MYQAAKAPTKATFEYHMAKVKSLNDKAHDKLLATPLNTWANHECRDNVIWDQVTSNMSESVNNMIGSEVWSRAVLAVAGLFSSGVFGCSCSMCLRFDVPGLRCHQYLFPAEVTCWTCWRLNPRGIHNAFGPTLYGDRVATAVLMFLRRRRCLCWGRGDFMLHPVSSRTRLCFSWLFVGMCYSVESARFT